MDKATALPGETLVYTLTYENTGNADATGATITDALPALTTFVSPTGGDDRDAADRRDAGVTVSVNRGHDGRSDLHADAVASSAPRPTRIPVEDNDGLVVERGER